MTAPRPIGHLDYNPHGLWTPDEPVRVPGSARYAPPYERHEFVDWHGHVGWVLFQPWMTPEDRKERIQRAESIHGPHSQERCCIKQKERMARGEEIILASSVKFEPTNYTAKVDR